MTFRTRPSRSASFGNSQSSSSTNQNQSAFMLLAAWSSPAGCGRRYHPPRSWLRHQRDPPRSRALALGLSVRDIDHKASGTTGRHRKRASRLLQGATQQEWLFELRPDANRDRARRLLGRRAPRRPSRSRSTRLSRPMLVPFQPRPYFPVQGLNEPIGYSARRGSRETPPTLRRGRKHPANRRCRASARQFWSDQHTEPSPDRFDAQHDVIELKAVPIRQHNTSLPQSTDIQQHRITIDALCG